MSLNVTYYVHLDRRGALQNRTYSFSLYSYIIVSSRCPRIVWGLAASTGCCSFAANPLSLDRLVRPCIPADLCFLTPDWHCHRSFFLFRGGPGPATSREPGSGGNMPHAVEWLSCLGHSLNQKFLSAVIVMVVESQLGAFL